MQKHQLWRATGVKPRVFFYSTPLWAPPSRSPHLGLQEIHSITLAARPVVLHEDVSHRPLQVLSYLKQQTDGRSSRFSPCAREQLVPRLGKPYRRKGLGALQAVHNIVRNVAEIQGRCLAKCLGTLYRNTPQWRFSEAILCFVTFTVPGGYIVLGYSVQCFPCHASSSGTAPPLDYWRHCKQQCKYRTTLFNKK